MYRATDDIQYNHMIRSVLLLLYDSSTYKQEINIK